MLEPPRRIACMILVTLSSLLIARAPATRRETGSEAQHPWQRSLRNVLNLNLPATRRRDFLARCLLLGLCAVACYHIGAGAALLMKAAPLTALVLLAALIHCVAMTGTDSDR